MAGPRRVSVIVPTCNRPRYLREALASIRALEGDDLQFEIIVGDNGSAPETRAIAEAAGAIYIAARGGKGASVARNGAMVAATGSYMAFLDDDDVWLPTNIRSHIAHLETFPQHEAVIGRVVSADHEMRPVSTPWPADAPKGADDLLRRMLSGYFPQIGSVVARTRVRDAIGGFDERLTGGEDLDWLLRLARRNQLGFTPANCVLFRGRRRGSYDGLQLRRAGFDRQVFLRHALAARRVWRSPAEFFAGWYGTLRHFFVYFTDAAVSRAARGDRWGAIRAVGAAFAVFPLRTASHLVRKKKLGMAFWASVFDARRRRRPRRPSPLLGSMIAVAERIGPFVVTFSL